MARQFQLVRTTVRPRPPVPGQGVLDPLTLGQRFRITTRVVGWNPRVIYLEQRFTRGEELCARGLVAGRFLTRGSGERVPATEVVALLAPGVPSPPLPDDVGQWARAVDVAHRA